MSAESAPETEPSPAQEGASEPRARRRRAGAAVGALALVGAIVAGAVVDYPYVIEGPGPTANVLGSYQEKPIITVTGHKSYPAAGELRMTTVSISGGPGSKSTGFELLGAMLSGEKKILPEEQLYPKGVTQQQVRDSSRLEMKNSQSSAVAAALAQEKIPYGTKVLVDSLSQGSPSSGKLEPGDQILAVNGVSIKDAAQIRSEVSRSAGKPVEVTLKREADAGKPAEEKKVSITPQEKDGKFLLGILIANDFDFPFDVSISLGDIGGPSAGLMFSLGIIDTLTPGDLTGGKRIAGTGTIAAQGQVGPIGGIQQKLYGARKSGAEYFLAPAENCPDVVAGTIPDGMTVVRVSTLGEAVKTVQAIAAGKNRGSAPEAFPSCR